MEFPIHRIRRRAKNLDGVARGAIRADVAATPQKVYFLIPPSYFLLSYEPLIQAERDRLLARVRVHGFIDD